MLAFWGLSLPNLKSDGEFETGSKSHFYDQLYSIGPTAKCLTIDTMNIMGQTVFAAHAPVLCGHSAALSP